MAGSAFAQGTSTGGAPPATHSSSSDTGNGRSGAKGGGGAATQYGTDPATLKKEETARQQAGKGPQPGASGAAVSK
ncbi:hypothetical protein ASG35_08080 [Burkholderia sp. Leaf177]|nr:hypothetical protein ASG35_08080 [Burkholderia sp. Leaf177]